MKSAAKRLATTSSSEASVWRRAAFFELRRKALLIFESADEAVRCAIDEAFGAKFKDGRVGAGRARAGSGAGALVGSGQRGTRRERARSLREASSVRRPRGDAAAKTASGVCREGAFGAREASVLGRLVAKCDV